MVVQSYQDKSKDNLEFFTIEEAAEILKLAKSTLYGLVHRRKIGYRKHGSRLIFTRDNIMQFSNSTEVSVADSPLFIEQNGLELHSPKHGSSLKTEGCAVESSERSFR